MSFTRRCPVPLGVVALALAAPCADAADIKTLPCVPYVAGEVTMPVGGNGFTPGRLVTVSTSTPTSPAPVTLTSASADPTGTFVKATTPPRFKDIDTHLQSFTLIGTDMTNPAAPIIATFPFEVVRFGTTTSPAAKRPSQKVTYTARGFAPGKAVYIHFRFRGKTRRTVKLGVASAPCGIVSRKMRALPTRSRPGTWTAYTSQARRFSPSTSPMWKNTFTIFRRFL
ncbi:MAG TPA: hypothetical protein VGV67_12305 [Solirubrobacteraceae bacterium]|nr:hypothetical protein [Solirubrobacteraceae bacterium]